MEILSRGLRVWPITKFETRGERLGHGVFDLVYERKASDQHL